MGSKPLRCTYRVFSRTNCRMEISICTDDEDFSVRLLLNHAKIDEISLWVVTTPLDQDIRWLDISVNYFTRMKFTDRDCKLFHYLKCMACGEVILQHCLFNSLH